MCLSPFGLTPGPTLTDRQGQVRDGGIRFLVYTQEKSGNAQNPHFQRQRIRFQDGDGRARLDIAIDSRLNRLAGEEETWRRNGACHYCAPSKLLSAVYSGQLG